MNKLCSFFCFICLCLVSKTNFAGCAFGAAISASMGKGDPYLAQLVENDSQKVVAQVGPISPGQNASTNIVCPSNPVIAKFINANNSMYQYSSTNSVILTNGFGAYSSLNNTFIFQVSTKQCYQC